MIRKWTSWMEKAISGFHPLTRIYENYYKRIVREEIELADIKSEDRVLVVGGGSVPCTAICIARKTAAQVDVIDIDKEAVERAKKLIEKNKLEDRIKIYLGNGRNVNIEAYDVVHLAMQISCKEEIVNRLWSKSRKGTRLIVRQPRKFLQPFYSNISEKSLTNKNVLRSEFPGKLTWTAMDNLLLMEK